MGASPRATPLKIFLMAHGEGSRWLQNYRTGWTPPAEYKQLIPIYGEVTLLDRTIGQVRRYTDDITLIAPGELHSGLSEESVRVRSLREPTGPLLEGIRRLQDEWLYFEGRVLFLLGDVAYSTKAIRYILSEFPRHGDYAFYMRFGPNLHTGKEAPEIFSLELLDPSERIATQLRQMVAGSVKKLWDLYRCVGSKSFQFHLDCYTDDVDSPEEYEFFFFELNKCIHTDDYSEQIENLDANRYFV